MAASVHCCQHLRFGGDGCLNWVVDLGGPTARIGTPRNTIRSMAEEVPDPNRAAHAFWRWVRRPSGLQAVVSVLALAAAGYSAFISSQSLQEFSRQIEITDRAWVKADVAIAGDMAASDEAYFFQLRVTLTNVGRSVATNVILSTHMFAPQSEMGAYLIEAPREQRAICDRQRKDLDRGEPFVLFPQEKRDVATDVVLTVEEATKNARRQMGDTLFKTPMLAPVIVGCVTYRYPSSKSAHSTRFGFVLSRPMLDEVVGPSVHTSAFPLPMFAALTAADMSLVPTFQLFTAD